MFFLAKILVLNSVPGLLPELISNCASTEVTVESPDSKWTQTQLQKALQRIRCGCFQSWALEELWSCGAVELWRSVSKLLRGILKLWQWFIIKMNTRWESTWNVVMLKQLLVAYVKLRGVSSIIWLHCCGMLLQHPMQLVWGID